MTSAALKAFINLLSDLTLECKCLLKICIDAFNFHDSKYQMCSSEYDYHRKMFNIRIASNNKTFTSVCSIASLSWIISNLSPWIHKCASLMRCPVRFVLCVGGDGKNITNCPMQQTVQLRVQNEMTNNNKSVPIAMKLLWCAPYKIFYSASLHRFWSG